MTVSLKHRSVKPSRPHMRWLFIKLIIMTVALVAVVYAIARIKLAR